MTTTPDRPPVVVHTTVGTWTLNRDRIRARAELLGDVLGCLVGAFPTLILAALALWALIAGPEATAHTLAVTFDAIFGGGESSGSVD